VPTDGLVEEAGLIRRFREGDEEAFRTLLGRSQSALEARIRHCLPGRLRRRIDVSDVLQDACVVALRRRDDLEPRGEHAFRNWLLGIVELRTREVVRYHERTAKRSTRREVTEADRPATDQVPSPQPSPSQVAIRGELEALVHEAMAMLPEDYREVLRLAREERLGLREAAVRMQRSHAATKKLYGRAVCRFRETLRALRGVTDA
jgi:RNA polymerase sigma-70 factor (ECF subfamily)